MYCSGLKLLTLGAAWRLLAVACGVASTQSGGRECAGCCAAACDIGVRSAADFNGARNRSAASEAFSASCGGALAVVDRGWRADGGYLAYGRVGDGGEGDDSSNDWG